MASQQPQQPGEPGTAAADNDFLPVLTSETAQEPATATAAATSDTRPGDDNRPPQDISKPTEGAADDDEISAGLSSGSLARTIALPVPRLERDFRMQARLERKVALGRSCWGERNWIGICGGEWSAAWGRGTVVVSLYIFVDHPCDLASLLTDDTAHPQPGGQDAQLLTDNKSTFVDTRYLLATADAPEPAHIMVRTEGWRTGPPEVLTRLLDPVEGDKVSPDEYRFRIFIRLETGDERYRWLNEGMWVGSGVRRGLEVIYDGYRLL